MPPTSMPHQLEVERVIRRWCVVGTCDGLRDTYVTEVISDIMSSIRKRKKTGKTLRLVLVISRRVQVVELTVTLM